MHSSMYRRVPIIVARTIADLVGSEEFLSVHLAEALQVQAKIDDGIIAPSGADSLSRIESLSVESLVGRKCYNFYCIISPEN